jgi:hypothetical protein
MKNFCETHHLGYTGARCPMCEKERIASFRVSKTTKVLPGQASRESYYSEYMKPEPVVISDSDMEAMLLEKFGKVSKI